MTEPIQNFAYGEKIISISQFNETTKQYDEGGTANSSGDFFSENMSNNSSALLFENLILQKTSAEEHQEKMQTFYNRSKFIKGIIDTSNTLLSQKPGFKDMLTKDSTIYLDESKREIKVVLPAHLQGNKNVTIQVLREIGLGLIEKQPDDIRLELNVKFDFGLKVLEKPHAHRKVLVFANETVFEYLPKQHPDRAKESKAKGVETSQDGKKPRFGTIYSKAQNEPIPGIMFYGAPEEVDAAEYYAQLKGCPDILVTQEMESKKGDLRKRTVQVALASSGETVRKELRKDPTNPVLIWLTANIMEQTTEKLVLLQESGTVSADMKFPNIVTNAEKAKMKQIRKDKSAPIPESLQNPKVFIIDIVHRLIKGMDARDQLLQLPADRIRSDIIARPPEGVGAQGYLNYSESWETWGLGIMYLFLAAIRTKHSFRDQDPTKNPLSMLYSFRERNGKKIIVPNANPDIAGAADSIQSLIDGEQDPLLKQFCTFCLEMFKACCKKNPKERPVQQDLAKTLQQFKKRYPKPFVKPINMTAV